jgi:hypothetical protein
MSLPFDGKHSAAPDDAHGDVAGNKVAGAEAGD